MVEDKGVLHLSHLLTKILLDGRNLLLLSLKIQKRHQNRYNINQKIEFGDMSTGEWVRSIEDSSELRRASEKLASKCIVTRLQTYQLIDINEIPE